MATDIHAEHVGSLLRQPWLLTARADYKDGKITEGELRAAEDRAAAENTTPKCSLRSTTSISRRHATAPYDIAVVTPDDFLLDQLDLYPGVTVGALRAQGQGLQVTAYER